MKKNKFKKYLKLGIFLLGISLLLVNCELKDENLGLSDSNIQVSHVSFKDLKEKKQLSGLFNKIETRFNKTPKIYGKNVYATDSTFYISTDFIYKTVKDSITNYSFKIVRPNIESTSIENLVVSKNNNTNALTLFIFEFYDANTGINSRYYQITDEELANNLFGKTIYIYGNPVEVQDCLNVSYEPCSGDLDADGHAPTSNCGGSATVLDFSDCFAGGGGGGGSGYTGGGSGYTDGGGYTGDNGYTSGGYTSGGGYNGGSTNSSTNYNAPNGAIAISDALVGDKEKPCQFLKDSITNNPLTKQYLFQMKQQGATGNEKGLRIQRNNTTHINQPSPNHVINTNNGSHFVTIFVNSSTIAVAHTHPDDDAVEMFSYNDIFKLAEMYYYTQNNSEIETTSLTHILITHGETYAIQFDDVDSAQTLLEIYQNVKEHDQFAKKLSNLYQPYNSSTFSNDLLSPKEQKRAMFRLLEEYNINISLYQANYDNTGKIDSWQEIDKTTIEKKPCN